MSGKTDAMHAAMAARLDVPRELVDAVVTDATARGEATVRVTVGGVRVLLVRPSTSTPEARP